MSGAEFEIVIFIDKKINGNPVNIGSKLHSLTAKHINFIFLGLSMRCIAGE